MQLKKSKPTQTNPNQQATEPHTSQCEQEPDCCMLAAAFKLHACGEPLNIHLLHCF